MSSSSEHNCVPNFSFICSSPPRSTPATPQPVSLVIVKNALPSQALIFLRDITMLFRVKKGHLYSKCHFDFTPFKIMNCGMMVWWSLLLFPGPSCIATVITAAINCSLHIILNGWHQLQLSILACFVLMPKIPLTGRVSVKEQGEFILAESLSWH